jgi:transposase
MKAPIFIRSLTDDERKGLELGLRSANAFVLRRCQILLASARGEHASAIARHVGCSDEAVRQVIHAFEQDGIQVLTAKSRRPKEVHAAFPPSQAERLKELLHHSPREYGQPSSLWTLGLAAQVSFAQGLTTERVSDETVRATLERLGVRWKRAKQWISSPDPGYERKKSSGIA